MLAKLHSFGLNGLEGYKVEVEADIHNGMPAFDMVGLPDASIRESKERVRSAIKNSRFLYPTTRITVNLAPADTKKVGAVYDLPIAVSILAASEQIMLNRAKGYCFLGELALDGTVRKVNGILPLLISAAECGFTNAVIPKGNIAEAAYLEGMQIYGVSDLRETVGFLNGENQLAPIEFRKAEEVLCQANAVEDFCYIKGQYKAKRAMEIAAAGGHNILLIGPPGAGKTMLARALPGILPDMTAEEALETTKIHSVSGLVDPDAGIVRSRPFRTPHHTATSVALMGGGMHAKPGEISLAHNGVLYLDELPEYNKHTLEALRQPLEDGFITIARANRTVQYPSDFMLVASMNPCPCGYYGSAKGECKCTSSEIKKYLSRISGPLLDRIDLQVEVDGVDYDDLSASSRAESSSQVKQRVDQARLVQTERFKGTAVHSNANMNSEQTAVNCRLGREAEQLLRSAFERLKLSARAHSRILKVARTIADLDGDIEITPQAIAESIQYRILDKKYRI